MMFAHLPASYVTMNATGRLWGRGLDEKERRVVYAVGIAAGIFPDIDGLFMPIHQHRASPLHTPVFWLAFCGLILTAALVVRQRRALLVSLAFVILMGAWLHLLLDAIFVGVRMFVPLSDDYFRFRGPISKRFDNWVVNYLLDPMFLTEVYVFAAAAMVFHTKRSGGFRVAFPALVHTNRKLLMVTGMITLAYMLDWFVVYPLLSST